MAEMPRTGYVSEIFGPCACRNCKHYVQTAKGIGCNQHDIIEQLGKSTSGLAPVEQGGWCWKYFDPKDKPKPGIGARLAFIGRAS